MGARMTNDTDASGYPIYRARRNDPATSHEAAESVEELAQKHHALILDVLKTYDRPMAAEEIADKYYPILDKVLVGRRLCELERAGLITKTEQRHVNRSGRRAFRYGLAGEAE